MKALVFKIALNKCLNNQKWIRMDGKHLNMILSPL